MIVLRYVGEVVVEGSVRLLGRDCGNIGISGEEVIWVVIEDVPRVVFIVSEAEVGVDGESEGMKALAAHLTGVSCGWLLVVLLLELGVSLGLLMVKKLRMSVCVRCFILKMAGWRACHVTGWSPVTTRALVEA